MTTYTCPRCHEAKPRSDFYTRTDGKRRYQCKRCVLDYHARWAASRPKAERANVDYFAGNRPMAGVDITPCTRCSLRGHVAGDPDRCIGASPLLDPTRGLGCWS